MLITNLLILSFDHILRNFFNFIRWVVQNSLYLIQILSLIVINVKVKILKSIFDITFFLRISVGVRTLIIPLSFSRMLVFLLWMLCIPPFQPWCFLLSFHFSILWLRRNKHEESPLGLKITSLLSVTFKPYF